ncbi:MAG: type I secretion system permease/ATPase [Alphaproteobacteria bacterium]|nr:type I secretion system permease/ATPase [Alphaproteobacteria bacterium]
MTINVEDVRPAQRSVPRPVVAPAAPHDPLLQSLSILAGLLERPISAEALRAGLPVLDERLAPEMIVRAAHRAGITAAWRQRALHEIAPANLPCVLLLQGGGGCVLASLSGEQATIILPGTSGEPVRLPLYEIEDLYGGYALFAHAEFRFDARTEDVVPPSTESWFWGTLKQFWKVYAHAAVASIVINLLTIASPLFVMNVYDRVVPNNAVATLWVLASGVLVVFIFDFILRTARSYFVDSAGKNADVVLASRIFSHVLGMRYDARPASVGALAANLREFETLRELVTSSTLMAIADLPFAALFILIIALVAGPMVALVPLLAVPVLLGIGFLLQASLRGVISQTMREGFQKHAILVESLEGLDTIKITGAEGRAQRLWERFVGATARTSMKARFLSTIGVNAAILVQNVVSVLVVVIGVFEIARGELTVGALVAASLLASRAMSPLSQIAALLVKIHHSTMSLGALNKVMSLPAERPAGKMFLHRPRLDGAIEFRGVNFAYPGHGHAALHGVSFRIEPGEKVGIVGRIGSGKSTLARLLAGLYQPSGGAILLDGIDLRQIDPADLRRNLGYVPQDAFLFFGSVKDNIALAAPHADHRAILEAATIAGVDDFVKRHPEGFDMPVGEHGRYLSGGQREAVTIARALLFDPPILVMDEPTGAMDNTAENRLRARLLPVLARKTVLLVTHRTSMLSLVDRLIVIDGGRIVADGAKDKVLQRLAEGGLRVAAGGAA